MHPALVGSRVGDELLKIADRQVLADNEQHRLLDNKRDRREVGCSVVDGVLVEGLVGGKGAGAAEHKLITVRRRLCDSAGPSHAARATDILDDHLLAQEL